MNIVMETAVTHMPKPASQRVSNFVAFWPNQTVVIMAPTPREAIISPAVNTG
jgi:hypothetical protein